MTSVCFSALSAARQTRACFSELGMNGSGSAHPPWCFVSAHIWKTSVAASRSTSRWSPMRPRSRRLSLCCAALPPRWSRATIFRMTSGESQSTSCVNSWTNMPTMASVVVEASSAMVPYVPWKNVFDPYVATTHWKNLSDRMTDFASVAFAKLCASASCKEFVDVISASTSRPNASVTSRTLNVGGSRARAAASPVSSQSRATPCSAATPTGASSALAATASESCAPWTFRACPPPPPTTHRTSTRSPPAHEAASISTLNAAPSCGATPSTSATATSAPCSSTTIRRRPFWLP
mmetsp:Transcript_17120/g.59545  ORF Transcript_17120/g.59545 Transcript_17120/m.59545 type:complete len:293 (-) Transcript_17120:280-1158(-)